MIALKVINVHKSFAGFKVLNGVSFTVTMGERRGIIGPNGAGKTTLFNIISGNLFADSGEIWILGKNAGHLPAYKRARLGMARTFQTNTLFFGLTLRENVGLALHGNNLTPEHLELLEQWCLRDHFGTKASELSYGQQRQLELLLAVIQKPHLILLDEPTAGMSPAETQTISRMISNLPRDITLLIIEHDMDIIFSLCDQVTILHNGQVIGEGRPDEVRSDPRVKEVYLGLPEAGGQSDA